MNSVYKCHKPIKSSQEWSKSYTCGVLCESDSSEFASQQSVTHRWNNIPGYH